MQLASGSGLNYVEPIITSDRAQEVEEVVVEEKIATTQTEVAQPTPLSEPTKDTSSPSWIVLFLVMVVLGAIAVVQMIRSSKTKK
jgi:hypothetical protein